MAPAFHEVLFEVFVPYRTTGLGYAMAFAMMPNLMAYSQINPGQPLVQRLTYRVNKTLDDRVLVTVVDFPGARNLR